MKQIIMDVLGEVYGTSKFNRGVNEYIADWIIKHYEHGTQYSWGIRQLTEQELTNTIWMNYSGGTTAAHASEQIIERTGMVFKEDVRF